MLDEQDGVWFSQVSHELDHQPGFVSAHSGQRFVKKEELRPGCDGHRQLELAALPVRKMCDKKISFAAESDALDGFPGRPTQARVAGGGSPEMKAVTAIAWMANAALSNTVMSMKTEVI